MGGNKLETYPSIASKAWYIKRPIDHLQHPYQGPVLKADRGTYVK